MTNRAGYCSTKIRLIMLARSELWSYTHRTEMTKDRRGDPEMAKQSEAEGSPSRWGERPDIANATCTITE